MFKKTETGDILITPTKINQDTSMKGEIISKNDIRLDGILNGKMTTKKKIIIGKNGFFSGKLKCEDLIVQGSLEGEASVSNRTSLLATSSFNGVLSTHKFSVEEGATFQGDCKTTVKNNPIDLAGIKTKGEQTKGTKPIDTSNQKDSSEAEFEKVIENAPENK